MFLRRISLTGALLFSIAVTGLVFVAPSVAWAQDDCDGECRKDLAAARRSTAKYHREDIALADGYQPVGGCVAAPGLGGMGVHYANFPLSGNLSVDPSQPENLLYAASPGGKMRLVAVEYFVPVIVNGAPWFGPGPPPAGQFNAAPELFGRTFDGPMPGHEAGMPWHYDLHVWVWKHNPSGMFAPFNPTVECGQ